MNKLYFYLLTLSLVTCSFLQAQQTLTISHVEFDAPTGTITRYCYNYTDIIIPSSLQIGKSHYEVKSIGANAFSSKKITSVLFPSTLTEIGDFAFYNNQLISINLPPHITKIGYAAFNKNNITTINNAASNGIIFKRKADGTDDKTTIVSYSGATKAIEKTHIPASVTTIDRDAFSYCELTSVKLPNTVKYINYGAFGDNFITNLILPGDPNTQLFIDRSAFWNNPILSLTIPANITYIGGGAFCRNSISSLIFQTPLQNKVTIENHAFEYNSLSTLNLPEGITQIGQQAFCSNNLTEVTLPNTLTHIESYAFYRNNLTSVTLPTTPIKEGYTFIEWQNWHGDKVSSITDFSTSYSAIFQKEGAYTLTLDDVDFFAETGAITDYHGTATNIQIPNYFVINNETVFVQSIGTRVFYGKNLTNVVFPNSVYFHQIGEKAFENNNLTEIEIPNNVSNIGPCAFNNNQITEVNGEITNGIIYDRDRYRIDKSTIISYGGAADVIDFIPSHVKHLEYFAFARNGITSVTIPENIESINCSFNDNAITEVDGQPSNGIIYGRNSDGSVDETTITSYGGSADIITEEFIPSTVKNIGYSAFAGNGLTSVKIPANICTIDTKAFSDNVISGTLTIPQGVERILNEAFCQNNISQVELPNSIEEISAYAFDANNKTLTSIPLTDVVKNGYTFIEWQNENHEQVNAINNFTLGYKAILQEAAHMITINDIDFNKTTGTITRYYAYNSNIEIPTVIDDVNVLCIGQNAFQNKAITNVTLPQTLKEIHEFAFAQNELREITIPSSVNMISYAAFNNNAIIEINGSPSNGIIYARGSSGLKNTSKIVSYAGISKAIDFIPQSVTIIGKYSFRNSEITSVVIPSNVEEIGVNAFEDNKINEVIFNEGLDMIERSAFECNNITELTLPNSLRIIDYYAFWYNKIENVQLGNGLHHIGRSAFAFNNVNSIELPIVVDISNDEKFIGWIDSNGNPVTHITNFYISYDAQFSAPTDIENTQNENCVIYPNPAIDIINIKYKEPIYTIDIFDITGNKVLTKTNASKLNISHLQPGIYIIKIYGEQLQVVKQILKK